MEGRRMAMDKILFISDLDGTLLDKNSMLSEYTKVALNELISEGIYFSVATGRTTDAAMKIMSGIKLNIPIVTFNGVVIYDTKHERFVNTYRLSIDAVEKVVSILKSKGAASLMYELKDNRLVAYYESLDHKPICDFIKDRKTRYDSSFCQVDDFTRVAPEHIIYFTLLDTYDRIKPVYNELIGTPDINLVMVDDTRVNGLWWLEIYCAKASKENAVAFLRDTYGYTKVVCFGDNYNDLPMFEACDVCVAVENALDEIKSAADYICEAHDKDGVVKWMINHYSRDGKLIDKAVVLRFADVINVEL